MAVCPADVSPTAGFTTSCAGKPRVQATTRACFPGGCMMFRAVGGPCTCARRTSQLRGRRGPGCRPCRRRLRGCGRGHRGHPSRHLGPAHLAILTPEVFLPPREGLRDLLPLQSLGKEELQLLVCHLVVTGVNDAMQDLSEVGVWNPNDGAALDRRVLLQGRLHLSWVDVRSAHEHHVVLSVPEMQTAVLVEHAHVADRLPALGVAPALRPVVDVGVAVLVVPHPDLPHRARRQLHVRLGVHDLQQAACRLAHAIQALDLRALYPLVATDQRVGHRLGRPVELVDLFRAEPVAPTLL
mmetsp:Transcript_55315/g.139801  ORF Transcript_55315/g.139801 Transcript_55315/m.139801 type:complete len:297 (+) Transcript_55315:147-1037(+)